MSDLSSSYLLLHGLRSDLGRIRNLAGPRWPVLRRSWLDALRSMDDVEDEDELATLVRSLVEEMLVSPAAVVAHDLLNDVTIIGDAGRLRRSFITPEEPSVRRLLRRWSAGHEAVATTDVWANAKREHVRVAGEMLVDCLDVVPEAPEGALDPAERRVVVWITERPTGLAEPLECEVAYKLNLKVGAPEAGGLVDDAPIDFDDYPPGGLATHWVVLSHGAELTSIDDHVTIEQVVVAGAPISRAKFSLLLQPAGDSDTVAMQLKTHCDGKARLEVFIYAKRELYRKLDIPLSARAAAMAAGEALPADHEYIQAQPAHLNLRPLHEWTTPPGTLTLCVSGALVNVYGDTGPECINTSTNWYGNQGILAGLITNVRLSAEKLRATHEAYFNAIDAADLDAQCKQWTPTYRWENIQVVADAARQASWQTVSTSTELRDLVADGYSLFNAIFPSGSDLRKWIDALGPGHRLNLSWLSISPGWVPHIPLGLMYVLPPPAPGVPVDPMGFAAFRFRLEYSAHAVSGGSKALGRPDVASRVNLLYWGDHAADTTGKEARWQRSQWSGNSKQQVVPASPPVLPKQEILNALRNPQPAPVAVLYMYCQCSVGAGNDPVLQFGGSMKPEDVVRRTELGSTMLADRPLVFANACTTTSSDPYVANELERSFFARSCRAYIGTETKVPIELASRFATVFFRFFERQIDPAPIASGEALGQARLFLWSRYLNIGGLFYSAVNQYELFMADDAEVRATR